MRIRADRSARGRRASVEREHRQTGRVFDAQQDEGFFSVIHLAQALEHLELTTPIDLNVVTSGVAPVLGREPLVPAKATVIAPCRVISQEYPHIRCRLIDVDDPSGAAGSVVAELTREPFEPTVAYRGGRRWLQAFDAACFEPAEELPRRTRDRGVYLITGGLGKIGTVLCAFLARTTADVKLVLTGRSELPPESRWDSWLEADPDSALAQRIRGLRDLQTNGAEVLYLTADAADRAEMAHVVEEAERRFGRIDGVVHAAGDTESYTPVNEVERADVEAAVPRQAARRRRAGRAARWAGPRLLRPPVVTVLARGRRRPRRIRRSELLPGRARDEPEPGGTRAVDQHQLGRLALPA